jgi:hypothetical protein
MSPSEGGALFAHCHEGIRRVESGDTASNGWWDVLLVSSRARLYNHATNWCDPRFAERAKSPALTLKFLPLIT